MAASIQYRVSVTRNVPLLSRVAPAHYAFIFASVSYDIVSVRQDRQDAEIGLINCGDRSDKLRRQVRQIAEAGRIICRGRFDGMGCGTCWSKTLTGLGKIWKIELMSVSLHLDTRVSARVGT